MVQILQFTRKDKNRIWDSLTFCFQIKSYKLIVRNVKRNGIIPMSLGGSLNKIQDGAQHCSVY